MLSSCPDSIRTWAELVRTSAVISEATVASLERPEGRPKSETEEALTFSIRNSAGSSGQSDPANPLAALAKDLKALVLGGCAQGGVSWVSFLYFRFVCIMLLNRMRLLVECPKVSIKAEH